jgi:hypothetical protein
LNFCKYIARANFLEKSDGPFRTPKTFVELKNIYPNFVYNKGTNYNLATLKNVKYKCVKSEVIHAGTNLKCAKKHRKASGGVRATTICDVWCALKLIHLHLKLGRFQMPFLGSDCKDCCSCATYPSTSEKKEISNMICELHFLQNTYLVFAKFRSCYRYHQWCCS